VTVSITNTSPTRAAWLLGLLLPLSTAIACDLESEDELESRYADEFEQELGVEFERQAAESFLELNTDVDGDETIDFAEPAEFTDPSAEPDPAVCGTGYWQLRTDREPCECDIDDDPGEQRIHYKRWCWNGAPGCGGCGGWQYIGWSCHSTWQC